MSVTEAEVIKDGAALFGVLAADCKIHFVQENANCTAVLAHKTRSDELLEGEPSTTGRVGAIRNLLEMMSCGLDDQQWEDEVG